MQGFEKTTYPCP